MHYEVGGSSLRDCVHMHVHVCLDDESLTLRDGPSALSFVS